MHKTLTALPVRRFLAFFSDEGLARLEFPRAARQGKPGRSPKAAPPPALCQWLAATDQALQQALAGKPPAALPPLDLAAGSSFQQKVWKTLLTIPPGQTRTYAQVAARVGRPKAARAVGQACGANPIPVLIPCHRVVSATGGLGGFSAGIRWKKRLLAAEGHAGF